MKKNAFITGLIIFNLLSIFAFVSCKPSTIDTKKLKINSLPDKLEYRVGDVLELAGLVVVDYDSDLEINDYISTPSDGYCFLDEDVGDKNITISKEGYESASFTVSIIEKLPEIQTIDIYATNDIHGQIESQSGRASIGKMMTYLKEKGEVENTLLLDQGDTWQGNIYSNYNHGELITDLMNYVRYDARTIGNHDFDWGIDYLISNGLREYNGYRTPTLAANVYDFDFDKKEVGNIQQSDIGVKSVTYLLENGVRVGIIGTIGKSQISSITSLFVQNITFVDHIQIIKNEATKLREEGCDIVISSCHAGQEELLGNSLENYVDLVLCAHTHKNESTKENGLLYAQYGAYNNSVGHIKLKYDPTNNSVTYDLNESISGNAISRQVTTVDSEIDSIITEYNSECDKEANQVVASNVSGGFSSSAITGQLPNLMCKAIYDTAVNEGFDIDFSYCNQARYSFFYKSSLTYADLYQAFPFDNVIYICEVSYEEMKNEVYNYNNVCHSPFTSLTIKPGETYKVACLDYLLFHTNDYRYYDFFPDVNGKYTATLSNNYRVILKNWLIDNGYSTGKLLSSSDYNSSNDLFNKNFVFE